MEPRYYDPAGHIDYDALKAYAHELRRQAIATFWPNLLWGTARVLRKSPSGRSAAEPLYANYRGASVVIR